MEVRVRACVIALYRVRFMKIVLLYVRITEVIAYIKRS
jgi:hypothetical protein